MKRQKVFCAYGPDSPQFKYFCNHVNWQGKICRGKYWVKDPAPKRRKPEKMVGWNNSQINIKGFSVLPFKEQANTINAALLKPLEEYKLPAPLEQVPLKSDSPEILRVSEQPMQRTLDVLNPRKACEPDRTSSWLLKGYCDLVAFPIMEILTASYTEQRLPTFWKMADVTTLPKRNQWSTSKRNWDQYPWPPVFLKWQKSLTWMVSWNLQSWTSLMTTSTEPFQIPQLQWL